jgi:spermidine synthase
VNPDADTAPRLIERVEGRLGELALRARGPHHEIIANGCFLMDTRDGRSEQLLARLALGERRGPLSVLIGGLGVGFTLAEALASDAAGRVTVIEIEQRIIDWNCTFLARHSNDALADPRVRVVNADILPWLRRCGETFDAICLDVDNGPAWTVADANGALYADESLALLSDRLKPGGVLTIWSAAAAQSFAEALRRTFKTFEVVEVPVRRGEPDVIYVASR